MYSILARRLLLGVLLASAALPGARAAAGPRVVVSLAGCTLRLELGDGTRRVFPVGVGRLARAGQQGPVGIFRTGPDPADRDLYLPSRKLPAFHRGLPFIRLDLRRGSERPFGLHGPVSPTLIWGHVSRGCVRMRPAHIRLLYQVAARHPGMTVKFIRGLDQLGHRTVIPDASRPLDPRCPDATVGLRRLRRLALNRQLRGRVCGGVDHWYALALGGGDVISVRLDHGGDLRAELIGVRAISSVARGARGFVHRVPMGPRNRGDRYLRITSPGSRTVAYTLSVNNLDTSLHFSPTP